jgi:hypothetical protein
LRLLSCLILQARISTAITKINTLNGQLWRFPRFILKGEEIKPLFRIHPLYDVSTLFIYRQIQERQKKFNKSPSNSSKGFKVRNGWSLIRGTI